MHGCRIRISINNRDMQGISACRKSPLRLQTQLVTPNHWLVKQRMNMR